MRKRILVISYVVGVVILIALLLPWGMGLVAHKRCMHLVNIVNSSATTKITILNYHRGWFTTTIKAQITYAPLAMPELTIPLIVGAQVSHGPIVIRRAGVQLGGAIAELTGQVDSAMAENKPTIQGTLTLGLTGTTNLMMQGAPFAYGHNDHTIRWDRWELKVTRPAADNEITILFSLPELDIKVAGSAWRMVGVTSSYRGKNSTTVWGAGEQVVQLQELLVAAAHGFTCIATGVNLYLLIGADNTTITLQNSLTAATLVVNGNLYRENLLRWESRKLATAELIKLQQEPRSFIIPIVTPIINVIYSLLHSGGTGKIKQFVTFSPWGRVELTAKVEVPYEHTSHSFTEILGISTIYAKVKVAAELAHYLVTQYYINGDASQITPAAASLFASDNMQGEGAKTTYLEVILTYKDNKLLVNGQPLLFK